MKTTELIAKIGIAAGLGLLTPLVFIIGAEPFETPGQNPMGERVSGGVVLALYLVFCQLKLVRKEETVGVANWSVVVAMAVPVAAWAVYFLWRDGLGSVWITSGPILAAGICGIGAGAFLAVRRAQSQNKKAAG